jgi:hypothetical protein
MPALAAAAAAATATAAAFPVEANAMLLYAHGELHHCLVMLTFEDSCFCALQETSLCSRSLDEICMCTAR